MSGGIILTPLVVADEVECDVCHGSGEMCCNEGCHTVECDKCGGTGYIDSGEVGV